MTKKKPIGFYDYTVILTYCGMLFAFCGILRSIGQDFKRAVICLMFAGLCDMFDGAVASTKQRGDREKRFGIQIDSLSDLISFGVLPGIFVYSIANKTVLSAVAASLYVLCALIRLAYYNVMEEERQKETTEPRKYFLGLPVTTVAVLLPFMYMIYGCLERRGVIGFPVLLFVMSVCFLAPVEVRKPGNVGKVAVIILGVTEVAALVLLMVRGVL